MTPVAKSPALRVRNVLVPLDGSELALRAIPTARALARRLHADVHTVTVTVAGADGDVERARAHASSALGVPVRSNRVLVVGEGDPADLITHRAETIGRCVVCLATRGRGRVRGAVMGSVARSVLQRSVDPLVALGPSADNPGWSPRPRNWPEPLSVPRIVACVDGSTASEQVLPLATAWAGALRMSLTLLTVIEDVPAPIRPDDRPSRYGDHADAQTYIAQLVQHWSKQLRETDGVVVRDPLGPARGIRAHLAERPAGLVALTTHARSGVQRVLRGATAASIVHASGAPCVVASVRM